MKKLKNRLDVHIDKNALQDDNEGTVRFNGGLTLSDESEQFSGTRYDLASMDISSYDGRVFADHDMTVTGRIGTAFGLAKQINRLIADGITFAIKESTLARFYYDMVRHGWATDVSISTVGPPPDEEGVIRNAEVIEFSVVGIGNNRNAKVSQLAHNTIEHAEADGLDTVPFKKFLQENGLESEPSEPEPEVPKPEVKQKVESNLEGKPTMNRLEELQAKKADASITADEQTELEGLEKAELEKVTPAVPTPTEEPKTESIKLSDITGAIANAVKPLTEKIEKIEKDQVESNAVEPQFTVINGVAPRTVGGSSNFVNGLKSMPWQERAAMQVQAFYKSKQGDMEAAKALFAINKFHKEGLADKGIIKNVMDMTGFGNFVTSPEMLTEIEGYRTDFSSILSLFPYRNTNSLQMAWLNRDGDIDMTPVEMCDDDADGNLKPISEYDATPRTNNLEEMAAVTPVCTAATIFLAADLMQDVSAGYRNSYERNLARGIIAALELAAEDNDDASFAESGDLDDAAGALAWLADIRKSIFAISQGEGVLIMNENTYGLIWNALVLAGNGGALTDTVINGVSSKTLWQKRVVVVANELMPTLGLTDYKTFSLNGANVTINHAIFYVNPSNFSGRQNGGLRYDLSTDAAYEINGTVRSAYQRNEIVLRGSMFRGAVIRDHSRVGAVRAGAVIS